MCTVALADGRLDRAEILELRQAASFLKLGRGALTRAFAAVGFDFDDDQGENQQQERAKPQTYAKAHLRDLDVLGLDSGATKVEIRVAYIELVKRYHPDRLVGQGLPENEVAKAEAILKSVNAAYERLKERSEGN